VKIVLTEDDPNRFKMPDYVTKIYTPENSKYSAILTNTKKDSRETWRLQALEFDIDTGVPTTKKKYESKKKIVEEANKIASKKGKNVRFEVK